MSFDYVWKSSASQFSSNTLTIPDSSALYWMHIGVEVPAGTQAHIQIAGTSMSIWKTYSALNGIDTMTSDGFVQASPGTKLTLITEYATSSSQFNQTYWMGFRLDNYFSPLVAFSVALSKSYGIVGNAIPFDIVLLNAGNKWYSSTSEFIPPQSGIYFFRFSVGVIHGPGSYAETYNVGVQINGEYPCVLQTGIAAFVTENTISPSATFDIVGRTCLLELDTNDRVSVYLIDTRFDSGNNVIISSTTYQQTTFSGFLYSPFAFVFKVSVTRISCWLIKAKYLYCQFT